MSSEAALTLRGFVSLQRGTTYKGSLLGLPGPVLLGLASISPDGGFRRGAFKTYGGESPAKITLKPGDIYVSLKDVTQSGDLLGSVARMPSDIDAGRLTQDTVKLEFHGQPISKDFVYWLLRTPAYREYCRARGTGTTTLGLGRDDFLNFPVWVPSAADLSLVELLDGLDDRIALLRETNATLEAIAQALFKSWFVDFDPVRAKMEGRAPESMDETTAALFPDGLEGSELGLVPRGWRLVPFGQLLCHTIGGDWGSDVRDEKNDARVAIIRGTDIPDLQSGANNRVPVRYTSQKKLATRRLRDGDIVLEVSGGSKDQPTGRALYLTAGLLGQFDCPVEPASFCRLLRPNTKDIGVLLGQHLTYIYAQGKTWEYQNQSTGIANFQTTHFLETELVAVPGDDVLSLFADTIRPMIDRAHLTQIQQLATLRATLLPRLISGQLRLPDELTNLPNITN